MILEWLAALEGIASTAAFVALIWQLRLVLRQMRFGAVIHIYEVNRDLIGRALDNPDLAKTLEGKPAENSATEKLYVQQWFNQMNLTYLGQQNRFLPKSMRKSLESDMADFINQPRVQGYWASLSKYYPEDFQRFVAGMIRDTSD